MADLDNTQTKPAGLPEKEWFTLSEVAERWSGLTGQEIKEDDLLHWGINGLLGIYFMPGSLPVHFSLYEVLKDGTDRLIQTWQVPEGQEKIGCLSVRSLISAPSAAIASLLTKAYWTGAIHRIYSIHDSMDLLPTDMGENKNIRLYRRTHKAWFGKNETSPAPIFTLSRDDLLVTKLGRDRFEKEHRIGAFAGTMPDLNKPDRLDPRKETTYLQIIRALLAVAKMPPEPYKAAEALMQDAAAKGLVMPSKRDTIAEKLKDARDLSD